MNRFLLRCRIRNQVFDAVLVLHQFRQKLTLAEQVPIDRYEVVVHATLWMLAHHWPSQVSKELLQLLTETQLIKEREKSRWTTQRRIALSKLVKNLSTPD